MKVWHAILCSVVCLLPCMSLAQAGDPAGNICLAVLSVNMRDTNNIFSDQYHYSQYQTLLKNANFSSYSDYSSSGGKLGIDIPIADDLIGFKGDYKSNNGTFRKQMSDFLTSSYSQSVESSVFSQQISKLNDSLLKVADNCQTNYFNSLRDRLHLTVSADANSPSNFLIKVAGFLPQEVNQRFRIDQIEPEGLISCKVKGQPPVLPLTVPTGSLLLSCTKNENDQVYFAVSSNAGASQPLLLPKKKDPIKRVAPTPVSNVIKAVFGPQRPATGQPLPFPCSCLSSVNDEQVKQAKLINNCNATVPVLYVKDADPNGRNVSTDYSYTGRQFAFVSLDPQKTAIFDMSDAAIGTAMIYSCPGVKAPSSPLRCVVNRAALPPSTPPTSCEATPGVAVGSDCTCPKFVRDGQGFKPDGTYPGKVTPPGPF